MDILDHIKWSDDDVVNIDDYSPAGDYNPHNVRPWLLHDHGFVVCIVFADCLQDALDIAVDENKMGRYLISEADMKDYLDESTKDDEYPTYNVAYLGNAGEPFDIESLGVVELTNPPMSFKTLFDSHNQKG